jgi:hypothetical protein
MKSIFCLISSGFLSFFSPNIILRRLFLKALGLCSSLNMKNQVVNPLETTGMTIVYIKVRIIRQKLGNKTFPNE